MKIAFFTDDYLPHVHGVSTSIRAYREALEALGHEVFIVAPKKPGYDDNDDHIIRMPSIKSFVFDNRPTAVLYPGMAKKLDKYQFDIIHSQTQFYLGVLAQSVAKRQGIPHVTTIHTLYTEMIDDYPFMITAGLLAMSFGYPFAFRSKPILPFKTVDEVRDVREEKMKDILKKQGWRLTAEFANRTDGCIAPSQHLLDKLTNGGLTVPCHVFPNSINISKYRGASVKNSPIVKKRGEKFIVYVGRLSAEKRVCTVVEAMAQVKDPTVKLVVAGNGPSEEELMQRAEELGVANRIVFTGMLDADAVAGLLKQANIFTLASYRFDNQPMSLLEAAASGVPVVYCDDNLKEGLTKANSVLTKGIEAEDFAKVFNRLIGNPDKLKEMSKQARLVAKQYDSISRAKSLVKIYQSAIEDWSTNS